MLDDGKDNIADLATDAADMMKDIAYKIPYLKEVVMGGELARIAFQYLWRVSPDYIKTDAKGAFQTAVVGRFTAFKNWLTAAWSGNSDM